MKELKQLEKYLSDYGDLSFEEKAFCEIDALIFSQLVYNDLSNIADNGKSFLFDCSAAFFALHSDEEIKSLIGISQKAAELLHMCAKTKRYSHVLLCRYINSVNCDIDKQFAAVTFITEKESICIAFRGTDTTIAGIKESAMMSYMFPIPAQIEAVHYFQETGMTFENSKINVCGHSKGGSLALYAAVGCSNSLKKQLADVYEFDSPGFVSWFFERYDYKQIKKHVKLYTPQTSIIGRMLVHDVTPVIIKSTNSGLKQHQVSSWVINGDSFEREKKYDAFSDFAAEYINEMIEYLGEDDLEQFFDSIVYVLTSIGIDDFYDFKKTQIADILSAIDSLSDLDDSQKERFKAIIKKAFASYTKEFFGEKAKEYIGKIKWELPPKTNDK